MQQFWQIENENFGPDNIGLEFAHAQPHRPFNIAFFCPFCGDIWARRIVPDGDPQWTLWTRPCAKHPNSISRGISGSVWQDYDTEYLNHMPLELLRREFLLYMETVYDNSVLPPA